MCVCVCVVCVCVCVWCVRVCLWVGKTKARVRRGEKACPVLGRRQLFASRPSRRLGRQASTRGDAFFPVLSAVGRGSASSVRHFVRHPLSPITGTPPFPRPPHSRARPVRKGGTSFRFTDADICRCRQSRRKCPAPTTSPIPTRIRSSLLGLGRGCGVLYPPR